MKKTDLNTLTSSRYRQLFLENPDIVVYVDVQGVILESNPAFCNLTGYSQEELVGKHFSKTNIFRSSSLPKLEKIFAEILSGKRTNPVHHTFYTRTGEKRHGLAFPSLLIEEGEVKCIQIVTKDITDEIHSRQNLIESEAKYRELAELLPETVFEYDQKGIVTFVNDSGLKKFKYSRRDFRKGVSILNLVCEEHREIIIERMSKGFSGQDVGSFEYKFKCKDGSEFTGIAFTNFIIRKTKPSYVRGIVFDISERLEIEEKLKKREKSLSTIINNMSEGLYKTKNGTFTDVNPSMCKIFGYEKEELLGMPPWLLAREELQESTRNAFLQKMSTADYTPIIVECRTKQGKALFVEIRIHMHDGRGELNGTVIDVTDRILAERALISSEEKYRSMVELSPDAIVLVDKKGFITNFNNVFLDLSGQSRSELLGKNILKLTSIHQEGLIEFKKILDNLHNEERNAAFEFIWNDRYGKQRVGEGIANHLKSGNHIEAIQIIIRDITDRKKTEQEKEANLQRITALLNVSRMQSASEEEILDFALIESIKLTSSKIGYIYYYSEENKQFNLYSWSNEALKECKVLEKMTIYDLEKTGVWGDVVRYRKPVVINDYKVDNVVTKGTPHGHVKLNRFLALPVILNDNIEGTVGVANKSEDYTDLDIKQLSIFIDSVWKLLSDRRTRVELFHAKERAEQSDRLKSAFLANMSHEIRTPMNAITGFSQLLQKTNITEEKKKLFIDQINQNSEILLRLIDDIIDTAKIDARQLEIISGSFTLNKTLTDLYNSYKEQIKLKGIENVDFILNIPDNHYTIVSDEYRIIQIYTNLIENALKFTESGYIEIGFKVSDDNSNLECFVVDTGIGIPGNKHIEIFERFRQVDDGSTRRYGGTGLGLAICKGLAKLMMGNIWVENNEPRGSRFILSLPFEQSEEIVNHNPVLSQKAMNYNWKGKTILIVEDQISNSKLLEEFLSPTGATLLFCETGTSAIDIFREVKTDLILMDIQLPGIDGYETTRRIRKIDRDVAIIAQTAFAMSEDKTKVITAGCNDYISKPIVEKVLINTMAKYLKG